MTWLSRLLPQSPSLQRLADHNHGPWAQKGRRRRRMANLEILENRALLAGNVTVSPVGVPAPGEITITLDSHSDHVNINENGGNTVTVTGLSTPGKGTTTVDSLSPGVSVTRFEVTSIVIIVPPSNSQNSPVISLTETAGVTSGIKGVQVIINGIPASATGPDVTLTVTGVKNGPSGTLSVFDSYGILDATVSGSQFAALSIVQFGCCPSNVVLDSDTVNGPVLVSQGVANGNSISLNLDHFGSTVLEQGEGPTMAGCNNAGSTISVNDSTLTDLTLLQLQSGNGQSISVGTLSDVQLSPTSFGIFAQQGDGNGDTILIVSITTLTPKLPLNNPHNGPDNIITIQGNGNGDSTVIDSSFVYGNIESFQGNGAADFVGFFGDTAAGVTLSLPPLYQFEVVGGLEEIIQGNGDNDVATLDCGLIQLPGHLNSALNVFISQGAAIFTPGCNQQFGDVINVNCTTVLSDMILEQGEGDATAGLDLGSNLINIATTTPVLVGDATIIDEIGPNNGNNTIIIGGASGGPDSGSVDFETSFLDIYTGAAGGAYVQVENTLVDVGNLGLFGPFNINGDGGGNVAVLDVFSSATVTVNPAF